MLEIRNVTKTYRTKAGKTCALDNVSANFPEKGMVFILGKSGSGKSTLLNVCGGLDVPDSGEILIKGRNTKDFSPTDLDSYRNTCVGFVFQEYNLLDEFSVEDNIALALELQGRAKDQTVISDILNQVELNDLAKRKPYTLSGGQKQRVAIARALVKSPEIIMADEPSGALDSATGKQVFDTLKKLSENKLVLVVSHDREFAEQYADRIIELKDGKIISDVVKTVVSDGTKEEKMIFVDNDTVIVRKGAKLNRAETEKLRSFIASADRDVIVSKNDSDIIRSASYVFPSAAGRSVFKESDSQPQVKTYTVEESRFIRSRLPLRRAIRIGASGMKIKPVRFAFTILLAVIAFSVFGMFSTVMFYDSEAVAVNSLSDSGEQYLNLSKQMVIDVNIYKNGTMSETMKWTSSVNYTEDDYASLKAEYGDGVIPVYDLGRLYSDYRFDEDSDFYIFSFVPASEANVTYTAGKAPVSADELALSQYVFDILSSYSYNNIDSFDDIVFQTDNGTVRVCGLYKTPYTADGLVLNTTMPYGNSTLGDNFYLSALVTQEFYESFRSSSRNSYPSLTSYSNGIFASANHDAFVTAQSVRVNSVGRTNVLKGLVSLDMAGKPVADTGEGVAVSYALWKTFFAPDLVSSAEEMGVGKLFSDEKDENGYTLKDKYNALNSYDFYDATGNLKASPQEFLSDILVFCNEYGLCEDLRLTFYDDDKHALSTSDVFAVVYSSEFCSSNTVFAGNDLYARFREICIDSGWFQEITTDFDFAVGQYSNMLIPVAENASVLSSLVKGESERGENSAAFAIENANYKAIESVSNTISLLADIFFFCGLGLAVFSALLLFNFISVSIADKKREIGILRAVGAKSSDVFKIFLSESMIIVLICAAVSVIATVIACAIANVNVSASLGVTLSLFSFNFMSVLLIFSIAVITAVLSTIIPVWTFSKMKPADAVRNA